MGLFDLDELPALSKRIWAFGYNRPALISLYDRDHGDGSGRPLRGQFEERLAAAGMAAGGPIRVLCLPRLFGYREGRLDDGDRHFRPWRTNGEVVAQIHDGGGAARAPGPPCDDIRRDRRDP